MEIELKPIRTMDKSVLEKDNYVIDSMERSILLIGPCQNGKSALATFLFNGRALLGDEKSVFPEGNGTHSFTDTWNSQNVTWCCNKVSYMLKIIDTPGTGDTNEEIEQSRMKDVYNQLLHIKNSKGRLNTIVLVVKYPCLLNKDLENNIKFYQKMIPEAINTNIILILTHVEVSESWRKKQMKGGKPDTQDEIKYFLEELRKIMNIDFNLTYETIDSHCEPDTDEERHGLEVRERIFKACIKSEGVNLDSLRLPKTKLLLNQCQSIKDQLKENNY